MKKILSIALIAMMILSSFSFVTYADENYDSTWSIVTDKDSYEAGEYMLLTVMNSKELENKFYTSNIHLTFDENILNYVTDVDVIYDKFDLDFAKGPGKTLFGSSSGGNLTIDGEFIDIISDSGSKVRAEKPVYYLCFQVKNDIKGVNELNFRWVLNENDTPSQVGYVLDGDKTEYYYNIDFANATVKIVGTDIENDPEVLPMACAYASTNNDLGETTINGAPVNITTNYAAAFGKVAVRKANAVKVKAGFLLSRVDDNMVIENTAINNFEAVNFSSENIFGGLFYGPGLSAGTTYYVMPYVTYSDGVTLYASEAASFTMPE